ncbi:MAG: site-2 protease family protein [Desulfamplus sp.]|nr:site-2 protease family protein [Desulfamplus sp.]
MNPIDIPFLIDFTSLQFDHAVIFVIAALTAITVNAEAQAFMATALGDVNRESKERFHFNPLLHIHPAGLICFAVAGFGWPKQMKVRDDRLGHPYFFMVMIRFAGAFANLLLAGIAGSILWIMTRWNVEDQVFPIVVAVNIMVFVFNFIPLPPLAGASLLFGLLPKRIRYSSVSKQINTLFPYLLVMAITVAEITEPGEWVLLKESLHQVVKSIFNFISGF